jgi:hypothetical protein
MLINRLLIWLARTLHISPLLAHVLLLVPVSIGFGAQSQWVIFLRPLEGAIWLAVCAAVVLATWLTKGKSIGDWAKAGPWSRP